MCCEADRARVAAAGVLVLPGVAPVAALLGTRMLLFIRRTLGAERRKVLFAGVFARVAGVGEGGFVVVFEVLFLFDAEQDFLADGGFEFES